MNAAKEDIEACVYKELEAADKIHKPFASPHEGWAVLREEIEEMAAEVDRVKNMHELMWDLTKKDKSAYGCAKLMKEAAIQAAAEAVQVAAMAEKFMQGGKR